MNDEQINLSVLAVSFVMTVACVLAAFFHMHL
jgi:hypothetical protein